MKVKLTGYIKNQSYQEDIDTLAIYQDQKLYWKQGEFRQMIDFSLKKMIRENKEYKIILTFAEKEDKILNCKLKTAAFNLDLPYRIRAVKNDKNTFFLQYEIITNEKESQPIEFVLFWQ